MKSKIQTYIDIWLATPSHPRASCPVFSTSHQGCQDALVATANWGTLDIALQLVVDFQNYVFFFF